MSAFGGWRLPPAGKVVYWVQCVRARPVPARTGRGESALSREKTRLFWRKLACLLPAVPLMALGISCNITADLGSDPYTSFQQGLAGLTGLRVGTVSVLVNVAIVLLFLLLDRSLINVGAVVFSLGCGPFVNLFLPLLQALWGAHPALWVRALFLAAGIGCIVLALSYYIPVGLGAEPIDMLAIYIGRLVRRTYGMGLNILNALLFVAAVLMGAPFGVGTVANVLCIGKFTDLLMARLGPLVRRLTGESGSADRQNAAKKIVEKAK